MSDADDFATIRAGVAEVLAERDALTGQLAAAQAVIESAEASAQEWIDAPKGELAPVRGAGREFMHILSQSPTDALQAVKAKVWGEGLTAAIESGYRARNGMIPNPYRAGE